MIRKNVTMSDIAKALGISTVSVSKALSGKEGVSDALREKINRTASEMGYRLHYSARSEKSGLTYNIGIIAAKQFFSEPNSVCWTIYKELCEILAAQNYYGMLEICEDAPGTVPRLPAFISEKKVDGAVLLGQFSDAFAEKVSAAFLPTVFLDFYSKRPDSDAVISDNFYGAYLLASHVISHGHKKIAFLGSPENNCSVQDRFLGFHKALLENRVALRREWVIHDRSALGEMYKTFELPPLSDFPTAFVCCCDESAYNLCAQLRSLGLSVPQNISVTGFENHVYSTMSSPHLTTVDINTRQMAQTAADIILRKIRDGNFFSGRTPVPCRLIMRDSVRNLYL